MMRRAALKRSRFTSKRPDPAKTKAWRAVKAALWTRAEGRCEVPACGEIAQDAHHVTKRSQGGPDTPRNCVAICRAHHNATDYAIGHGRLYIVARTFDSLVPSYGFDFRHDFQGWLGVIGPFTEEETPHGA